MTEFRYFARTSAGEAVRGRLSAPDAERALAGLQSRSLFVVGIRPLRFWDSELRLPGARRISARMRATFFRSFATLIRAGVPMRRSLQVAIERAGAPLAATLNALLADIERGDPLSTAMERRPRDFPPLITAMVAAGETGGILDDVLDRIAGFLERDEALRKSVLSALAYPATVLAASLALLLFLIVRIVPMFASLFASFHVDLPLSTRILLAAGNALGNPLPWVIAGGIAVPLTLAALRFGHSPAGRFFFDRLRLRLPLAGPLLRKSILARFARMLATLVGAGVELTRALDVVIPVTGSPFYSRALRRIAIALQQGEALGEPFATAGAFDPMLVALIAVGEETGMLDVMLGKAADYFEADVAAAVATLAAVIEPALIVTLGCMVGAIVYSIFVPLYSLIGNVSR